MLCLCGLVSGCANDQLGPRLRSWQGSHFNEVATAWGPPDECSVEELQRLCEWHARPTATSAKSLRAGRESCTTMLAFDAAGHVTGWRWRGDGCQQLATMVVAHMPGERPDALSHGAVDETTSGVAATGTD